MANPQHKVPGNRASLDATINQRHVQNTDTSLDVGGANEVSAMNIVSHIGDNTKHRVINDGVTSLTALWSSQKIRNEIDAIDLSDFTTDDLSEGVSNLYFTDARAISAIQNDPSWNATNWDTAFGWGDHAAAGYALDSAVVKLTGAQTVGGTKTFSTAPVVSSADTSIKYTETGDGTSYLAGNRLDSGISRFMIKPETSFSPIFSIGQSGDGVGNGAFFEFFGVGFAGGTDYENLRFVVGDPFGAFGTRDAIIDTESGGTGTAGGIRINPGGTQTLVLTTAGRAGFGGAESPAYTIDINGELGLRELTADPADPSEGASVMWQSDGTGSGDDGDIMMKITAGGVTKTATLIDFSAVA